VAKVTVAEKRIKDDPVISKFLSLLFGGESNTSPLIKELRDIYLFGSRARDDWRPDSDYDILIILSKKDKALKSRLYDIVMDVLLETGRLISLKIFTEEEFNRLNSIPTPFMEKVAKEGIRLGTGS